MKFTYRWYSWCYLWGPSNKPGPECRRRPESKSWFNWKKESLDLVFPKIHTSEQQNSLKNTKRMLLLCNNFWQCCLIHPSLEKRNACQLSQTLRSPTVKELVYFEPVIFQISTNFLRIFNCVNSSSSGTSRSNLCNGASCLLLENLDT